MTSARVASRPRKGELTRQAILERAAALASQVGLEGLSIGVLAEDLELSKSGLFAHFKSKEALQIQVLEHAARHFVEAVVRPALTAPRGEARIRAIFEHWLGWGRSRPMPGGCLFVAAASEMDDRPGPVRDALVRSQREWMQALERSAAIAIDTGDFDPACDTRQFAYEMYGVLLAYHHAARLLRDPSAEARARTSFEALVTRQRPTSTKGRS